MTCHRMPSPRWRSEGEAGLHREWVPCAEGLMPASVKAWETWMGAWFAVHWTPEDLPGLRQLVRTYDQPSSSVGRCMTDDDIRWLTEIAYRTVSLTFVWVFPDGFQFIFMPGDTYPWWTDHANDPTRPSWQLSDGAGTSRYH